MGWYCCFPLHCAHRLQALDVAFMKPLSGYYDDEGRKWLRTNPGRVVTFQQISSLFSAAYLRAATMVTTINGFKATGVWPVDMAVFSEADFLPSATTDLEIDPNALESQVEPIQQDGDKHVGQTIRESQPGSSIREKTPEPQPGSYIRKKTPEPQPGSSKDTSFEFVGPKEILGVPKVNQSKKPVSRKTGKTATLTSSPYKTELELAQEKSQSIKVKSVKRKIADDQGKPKTITKSKLKKTKKVESDSEGEDSDTDCLYCGEFYSCSTEGWVSCSSCHKWAHKYPILPACPLHSLFCVNLQENIGFLPL